MKKKLTPKKEKIIQELIDEFGFETTEDIHEGLKELLGPVMGSLLKTELDSHLGYKEHSQDKKETSNRRNGYNNKKLKTKNGEIEIKVPRDRESTFEPKLVPKRKRDISNIENKVLSMYAKGMSQRDISDIIDDIYGFELSHEMISQITDNVLEELKEWQNRPLKRFYTFLFVDCMYVTVRKDYEVKNYALYTILAYDIDGKKDILGIWLNESESKHKWMQIFDELKARGVEDILFICMDGVSGLEQGAKSIFPEVIVQRCIVHLIRNSLKYVPSKNYKVFTKSIKKVYSAPSLKAAQSEFEIFKKTWSSYPGAVSIWERNFHFVEQLFDFGSAVRKIIYTTNPIEAVNSSFRKVIKKGAFPNENAVFKVIYLRITELYAKWKSRPISNWALVRNQLDMDPRFQSRFRKFST